MKALTIRQPWASLVTLGVKTIETRSWPAPKASIGQTIAIHAGKHRPPASGSHGRIGSFRFDSYDGDWYLGTGTGKVHLPLGAIVATATLAECVPMIGPNDDRPVGYHIAPAYVADSDPWYLCDHDLRDVTDITDQLPYGDFAPGRWAWMLTDIKPCEPIPAKGKQGVWTWQP